MTGRDVVVVGAGVIGLTCAVRLAEAGHRVRVVAAQPPAGTTSAVAGGLWYPYRAWPEDAVTRWAGRTREVLTSCADDPATGVVLRSGRELLRRPAPDPFWAAAAPGLRRLTTDELPAPYADGFALTAPVVDVGRHLAWLSTRLGRLDVPLSIASVTDLAAVPGDVVVNATGLGAWDLLGDGELRPVRGQVVRLARPPDVTDWVLDEEDPAGLTYVIPRVDDVVCGGTADEGAGGGAYDADVEAAILQRCRALVPALADAPVVSRGLGWRPVRSAVRLERSGRVVHCYGHGGCGVTLSWGCAEEVVDLVES